VRISAASRRLILLIILAVGIGFAAGGAAYLLVRGIAFITNVALLGRVEWGEIPSLSELDASPRLPIAAIGGALVVSLMAMWAPVIRGHGIPETMEAVLRRQSRIQPRAAIAKPLSTAVAVGTGAPFGAEGPIIVTGGAIGSLVGQFIDVSPSERKILLASGAAAGMAATFGSPLASVLLAIELLLFELSMRSLIPLVVSTSIAGGIHTALFDDGPLFKVPEHDYAGLQNLPLYAILGLSCGLLAVLIAKGLFRFEALFRSLPIPLFWHPLIGAAGFAAIGLLEPRSLGVGTDVIEGVFRTEFSLGVLVGILAAKLFSWWIALASSTSGGTLAPVLLMSATFGGLFASVFDLVIPGLEEGSGTAFAVVAMAATFGAVARAPFTAIVFVFELTRDFDVMPPLMLSSVLAALVFTNMSEESLYTERLSRRGIRVGGELKADAFRTTAVGDVMNRAVDSLPITATVEEAALGIIRHGRGAYPLIDEDYRVVGIVSRSDLLAEDFDPDALLVDVVNHDVVTIGPDASLVDALQLMVNEDVNHLPVTEDHQLVGICTRADILGARGSELALERMETGWLAPVLQRRSRSTRRYVIVANQTLAGPELMAAITERADQEVPIEFHVVVPLRGDANLADARSRLERQLARFEELDVRATGEIGSSDPLTATEVAVQRAPTEEVLISTLPAGTSRWISTDLPSRVRRRLSVPVIHIESHSSPENP